MKTPVNFRDIGGLTTLLGTIAKGRLYRGGQLFELTSAEKEAFCQHYQIQTIIDLRNERSAKAEPNGKISGVAEYNFQVMKAMDELSKDNPMRNSNEQAAKAYLKAVYEEFITNSHANQCFKSIIRLLSQEAGAVYFHCFAGKDRTGIVAAIILSLLGATKEEILADYLLTIEGRAQANEEIIQAARAADKTEDELAARKVYLTVEADYLLATFAKAEAIYGSFDDYIRNGIGVSENHIQQLRKNFLG